MCNVYISRSLLILISFESPFSNTFTSGEDASNSFKHMTHLSAEKSSLPGSSASSVLSEEKTFIVALVAQA